MNVAVVILAGGEGARIGGDKPLRILGGERLIDRSLAFARSLSDHIALSISQSTQLPELGIECLYDSSEGWGPIGGIASALDFAVGRRLDLMLTLPCDSPFLPNDLLARLRNGLGANQGAAIPSSGGRLHTAATLWRSSVRERILPDYLATGRRSIQGLAERAGFAEILWPDAPVDPFFNINTADDLARAESIIEKAGFSSPLEN